MVQKLPSIPEPGNTLESLFPTVRAMQQAMNVLMKNAIGDPGAAVFALAAQAQAAVEPPWTLVAKKADQIRTATTTIAPDDELLFSMAAGAKYLVRGGVFFDTTASADFKWRHVGPASPTLVRIKRQWLVPDSAAFAVFYAFVDTAFSGVDLAVVGTGTTGGCVLLEGVVHNGANAGNFSFNWAQNTSDAGNTIVRAGSYLEYAQF
jgi:hypothetical protein